MIRRYPDRVRHVHLKDVILDPFSWMPLGRGSLDFEDILSAIKESGYDSWLMVELDNYAGDPTEAAQISMDFLNDLMPRVFN